MLDRRTLRLNPSSGLLLQTKRMFAWCDLLLPCLNLCLACKCIGFQDSLDDGLKLSTGSVGIDNINFAIVACYFRLRIISVLFRFCSNRKLRNLLRGLITLREVSAAFASCVGSCLGLWCLSESFG